MNLCFDCHLFINECKGLFCVAARGKRGGQRRLDSSSEEDFVDGVENTTPAPRSKRQTKGRQARQKPKVSFDSDSDSEIELFDLDKSSQGQWVSNELLTTSHKCRPFLEKCMCWWNSGWLCFYSCRCFRALPSLYLLHRWYIKQTYFPFSYRLILHLVKVKNWFWNPFSPWSYCMYFYFYLSPSQCSF